METVTPLIAERIALNEKKVAMSLDDLIKLSKSKTNKGKKPRGQKSKSKNLNVSRVSSLSAVRQGAVVKRRSYFHGKQCPVTIVTTKFGRKAANASPRAVNVGGFNDGRMTNANRLRLITPPVQNISVQARFIATRQEAVHEKVDNGGWRRKTLDSRFAIMKEQRKTHQSNNNNYCDVVVQVPRLPPWARARTFLL